MRTGIIKYWSEPRAFGFITGDDGVDIFFHVTHIARGHRNNITVGARVSFELAPPLKLGKSAQADNVQVLKTVAQEDMQSFFDAFTDNKAQDGGQ